MVGGTGGGSFSPTQTSVWVPCEEMRTLLSLLPEGATAEVERACGERGAGVCWGHMGATPDRLFAPCPAPCQRRKAASAPPSRPAQGQVRSRRWSPGSQTLSRRGAELESAGGRGAPRPSTGLSSAPCSRPWLRRGQAQGCPAASPRPGRGSWSGSGRAGGKSAVSASGCSTQ